MQGFSLHAIAKRLTDDHIKTPRGKEKWPKTTVLSILTNEKYKGDALLQKTFTTDFLTKTMKINEGEVPQYYVTGSHPAIIEPKEWDMVQLEIEKRERNSNYSSSIFAGRIQCAECGSIYGSKVWHSTDKYRKTIWRCNNKYSGEKCGTPHLNEEDIKMWFNEALGRMLTDREWIINNLRLVQETCLDPASVERKLERVDIDLEITEKALRQCISENATAAVSEEEYRRKYDELYGKFQSLEQKKADLEGKLAGLRSESAAIEEVIHTIDTTETVPMDFDPQIWRILVDKVLVSTDGMIRFVMTGGEEYEFRVH